jgi:VanZ family protein
VTAPASPAASPARHTAAARGSPLARGALAAYFVLLVYGSLSPWSGWRALGVGAFAYLGAPWPAYVTAFDLALNVLAYLPLGLLLVLALYPRLRGAAAAVAAVVLAGGVSLLLEAAQTYLPARIASNLDVLTNVAGAALGAVAGVLLAPALTDARRLQQARQRWFRPGSAALLLAAAAWPLAQLHPAAMLFGNGVVGEEVVARLLALAGAGPPVFDAGQFAAAEALATACGLLAAGGTLAAAMRPQAPRLRLLLLLLVAALAARAVAYGLAFGPERAFAWLTAGAWAGLAAGGLAVTAAATASARTAAALALAALLIQVAAVNAVAPNPYYAQWMAAWRPGRVRDLAAVAEWLAQAWPYATLAVLVWTLRRGRRAAAS